jgi:hypothetical protein
MNKAYVGSAVENSIYISNQSGTENQLKMDSNCTDKTM